MNNRYIVMVGGLIVFGMQASEQRTSLLTLQLMQHGKVSPSIRGKASMTRTETRRNLALSPLESPVISSSSASSDVESGSPQSDTGVRNMIEKEIEKIEAYSVTNNPTLLDAGIGISNGSIMLSPSLATSSNGLFSDIESGGPQSEKEVAESQVRFSVQNKALLDAGIQMPSPIQSCSEVLALSNGFFDEVRFARYKKDPAFALRFKYLGSIFKKQLMGSTRMKTKKDDEDFKMIAQEQESPDIFEFVD